MPMHNPPHPGRLIRSALEAIPMTVTDFAAHLGVARVSLSRIMNERAAVTAEMSIKLAEAFGQDSPDVWFKMQNNYDFWHASKAKRKKIAQLVAA